MFTHTHTHTVVYAHHKMTEFQQMRLKVESGRSYVWSEKTKRAN